ncbi:hypothetical protein GCM10010965_08600 [Caldalkalibacillus thermarum]|nr:hypothetical protein GCM10010965_08600 [Caldalkalibacillus thermarum]
MSLCAHSLACPLPVEGKAFREIYQEHGVDLPLEQYVQCVGTTFAHFDPYDYLEECLQKPVDRTALSEKLKQKHRVLTYLRQKSPTSKRSESGR